MSVPFHDEDAVRRVLRPATVVEATSLRDEWTSVHRVRLDDGGCVIVKERRLGPDWGSDPENLRNERAALETLTELGFGGLVAPAWITGDDAAGVVVMSDVGATTVEALVLDPNATTAAGEALVEHGRTLGRLHAATATPRARSTFVARRRSLSTFDPRAAGLAFTTFRLPDLWPEVVARAGRLGFSPPPPGVAAEVDDVFAVLADPGPWQALTHLDASPQNGVLGADGSVRLVDFEGASLRHLGLDACFLRFPFPSYGRWAVLPEAARRPMEEAYRAALVDGGLGPAADDADYAITMAVGCAALVILRSHRLDRIATDDAEALRRRTQIVSAIDVFGAASDDAHRFPRLADWYRLLADEMHDRWDEARAAPRVFAAFADRS